MNNLNLWLKKLQKDDQTMPKDSRRKEMIKIRMQVNVIDNRKTIESMKFLFGSLKILTFTNH